MVELDLRVTRDGEIVVLHDPTLERLWGIDRPVAELDLVDLVQVGTGDMRIPTLAQVVKTIEVPLMVDFTTADVVEGAIEVVRAATAMDRSLFVTGNADALRLLRVLAPESRIGLSWGADAPVPLDLLDALKAEYWNPAFWLVTPERVDAAHQAGRRVSTWTVDDEAEMHRVLDAGVDALVSNEIARLRSVLEAR
jgi:myo-inositol-1(or 4)-monophosphatase/deoxyribonuclease-2